MIRPATLADREAIIDLACLHLGKYPLRPDSDKMHQIATEAVSTAKHFCWVAESDGEVDGVLVGLTSDNLWAQRQNCNVVLWASLHGEGVKLLRKFTEWVNNRRAIKVAGMVPDTNDIDPRVWKVAERLGFKKHGGAYLLYN